MKKYNFYLDAFHYILLTAVLFLAFFSATWFGFVNMSATLSTGRWIVLFFWYLIFIIVGDKIIHKTLKI